MTIPGINIQWPWSKLLLDGTKYVETRGYPLPKKYLNVPLAIIETPGPRGRKEGGIITSRIIGLITFCECYPYESEEHWRSEKALHRVPTNDPYFSFVQGHPKWAWKVSKVYHFSESIPAPSRRGIKFTLACKIPDRV